MSFTAILIVGISILIIVAIIVLMRHNSIVDQNERDTIIQNVISNELPELIKGKTGYATSGTLKIWYEDMNPDKHNGEAILLVMGLNSTALLWTSNFYQPLIDAGFRVIRYDNRDVGMSSWIEDWSKKRPYSLEDMARDGLAVLDALHLEQAHVIGVSMGGMIAQRMAISHKSRVRSITSIMSTGFMLDPRVPPDYKSFSFDFTKLGLRYLILKSEANTLKFIIEVLHLLKGDGSYKMDIKTMAEITLYDLRKRRGFNRKAFNQQAVAIEQSGSRLKELNKIDVPALVIHGKSDPLIPFAHAEYYAPLIPNAKRLFIEGMGHDLPEIYMAEVQQHLTELFEQVGITT